MHKLEGTKFWPPVKPMGQRLLNPAALTTVTCGHMSLMSLLVTKGDSYVI